MKNFIIGAFILGSFSVQAAKISQKSSMLLRKPPEFTRAISEGGPYRWEDTTFTRAIRSLWGKPGERGKDPYYETVEGKIIYHIANMSDVTIAKGKYSGWDVNLARERAVEFLERFIYWSQTEAVSKAFDNAAFDIGVANPLNLESKKAGLLRNIETRRDSIPIADFFSY